jgi:hypothetical protein
MQKTHATWLGWAPSICCGVCTIMAFGRRFVEFGKRVFVFVAFHGRGLV